MLAIARGKGGCGKTTTALGLAAALARDGQRVILDCPAGATDAAAAPLRGADAAVVVSTPDRASCSDAVKTARMAEALGATVLGSVITRAPSQSPLPSDGEAARALDPVLPTVPPVDGAVLRNRIGRTSYDRLETALSRRNI